MTRLEERPDGTLGLQLVGQWSGGGPVRGVRAKASWAQPSADCHCVCLPPNPSLYPQPASSKMHSPATWHSAATQSVHLDRVTFTLKC